jgi:hypothetical protein
MPIAPSVRRPVVSLVLASSLAALASLTACADRNPLDTGIYTAKEAPFAGAKLEIAADKKKVTITLPGAPPIERAASAWEMEKWPQLCPRGMKNTGSEVLELGGPLTVGGKTFPTPVVIADCTHKPLVNLTTVAADGRPAWNGIEFAK